VLAVFLPNAWALIVHLDSNPVVVTHGFELDYASVGHRLARVAKQVEHGLAKLRFVHRDGRQLRRQVDSELDTGSIHFTLDELRDVFQKFHGVLGRQRGLG
jgi:hypothetical protein